MHKITRTGWQRQHSRTLRQLWKWYANHIILDKILSYLEKTGINLFTSYDAQNKIELLTCYLILRNNNVHSGFIDNACIGWFIIGRLAALLKIKYAKFTLPEIEIGDEMPDIFLTDIFRFELTSVLFAAVWHNFT